MKNANFMVACQRPLKNFALETIPGVPRRAHSCPENLETIVAAIPELEAEQAFGRTDTQTKSFY